MNSAEHSTPEVEPIVDATASAVPTAVKATKPAASTTVPNTGLSLWVSLLLIALGALAPLLIMASDRRLIISVPVGILGVGTAGFGILGALRSLGALTGTTDLEHVPVKAQAMVLPLVRLVASVVVFVMVGRLAVAGVWPAPRLLSGFFITLGFLWCVVEGYGVARALGVFTSAAQEERSLFQRHGFWLIVLCSLLHLPMLGSFGLIDPWETHYGEVAREMLSRDDWISLWWAHDGWFWSKPIFNFWIQGLSFKLFGVAYHPGEMIEGVAAGHFPQPEWACRLPVFFLATLGAYVLYKGASVPFGRRVAFIGSLILATCPYWYMIERQTMADMPYVAPLAAAMGALLLAFNTDPTAKLRVYPLSIGSRTVFLNGYHVLFVAIALCALPQALYLISRNVTLHTSGGNFGFAFHLDEFMKGSGGGNCGLPGNVACKSHVPLYPNVQPAVFGASWLATFVGLAWWYRRERGTQKLYFLTAWLFTALAVMGKGAPGLVIPLAVSLVYPVVSGRFGELRRMQLPALFVLLLIVALPWYIQMYMRHGHPFFERLILHDMFKRAFVHVHDTNKGDDTSFRYYLWQLGYGLFPWSGFAAVGFAWLGRSSDRRDSSRWHGTLFLLIWWLVAFGMFTITLTKFHHYILPLVPPTALFAGVVLAKYLPNAVAGQHRRLLTYCAGLFASAALVCWGASLAMPGHITGVLTDSGKSTLTIVLGVALCGVGLGAAWWLNGRFTTPTPAQTSRLTNHRRTVLSVVALLAAGPVLLAGRDMFLTRKGDVEGQARLLHLFTYNYERRWPATLDFDGVFLAFTLVCVGFTLLLTVQKWRKSAGVLLVSSAVVFSSWCVNVYFVKLAPHWGQRETIMAYYEHREGEDEPLVAYQMNWKGENFYTGNQMATFVASGKKFKTWITEEREAGKRTFFFTTEHNRVKNLKKELDNPDSFDVLTDEALNNKFALARAVFPPLEAKPDQDGDDDDDADDGANVGSQE